MTTVRPGSEPVLSEKWADFIQSGVAIAVASRDSLNIPTLVRSLGCRVATDRQRVTVVVGASQAEPLLNALRATRTIAVIFTQPSTHISVQLKGSDAVVARARAADIQLKKRCTDRFVADTSSIGYPEDLIRAVAWSDESDLMTITFTPISAFLQTPGPRAGESLSS